MTATIIQRAKPASNPTVAGLACDYIANGISVFPIRLDGSKAPAIPTWDPFKERIATIDEVCDLFRHPRGIAVVCGVVSGGLEVLDFDEEADDTFDAWKRNLTPEIRGRLCVVETGGFGYHVLYRCTVICGNKKIAMTADKKVLVESRGEGGYIVGVGSPLKVHASGQPYVQVAGEPLPHVPTFTPEERKTMWTAAASLDRRRDAMKAYVDKRVRELKPRKLYIPKSNTPWDDFEARASWHDVLEPHGWESHDGRNWCRPGADQYKTSAVVRDRETTGEVLVVFSTNAGALAPTTGGHRNLSKFEAFTELSHGGDRSKAAKELFQKGYGRNQK
ncbi:bifunctional DNA primase/polymerase [Crateriforma conspicua]|uniref:bifunctional DNA primase/polymerase n=1 Tax=Crateriforma conspicua TaxID=2527996 RepID=UPI0011889079|nr:bifunctional DNA primase/polymerase [Crateriforma conspicua]QDV66204.1 hypothetical protein Mal65_53790 [Crateriforma conspicua]